MSAQGKVTSTTELPPKFIRKGFPRTWYHPRWRLLTWYPRGVLNEVFADQVIDFIEMEGHSGSAFRSLRRLIWTDSHQDRNRSYHPHRASAPHSETTREDGPVRGQPKGLHRRASVRVTDVPRNDRSPRFQGTHGGGALARGAAEDACMSLVK
jgi:hypothetical protein